MNIISLLTDFGLKDNFVGVMKAVILKVNPSVQLIDISHQVKPQDITEAAFLLSGSFKYFPKGTVHLVVVDPDVGSQKKKLLVKTRNYYFIAPDNGVLTLALKDEPPTDIIAITNQRYFLKPTSDTFHGRDIFAPISAYVSRGEDIEKFGKKIKSLYELSLPQPREDAHTLTGEIIYIDRFGNLVSNIGKDTFRNFIKNSKFKVSLKNKTITRLSQSYAGGARWEPLLLIDSFNYLEVALNCGSARDYLEVREGTPVTVVRTKR